MEVKGMAVETIPLFVKTRYAHMEASWLDSLPDASKKIMGGKVLPSTWYPMEDAMIVPTQKFCDLAFAGHPKGAWEAGRFSAEMGLKGIYKIFVKAGSPQFIMKRASQVFTSYFRPSSIELKEAEKNRLVIHITQFPKASALVEHRIGGWMEKALEISGCKLNRAEISKSMAKGHPVTEFVFEWK